MVESLKSEFVENSPGPLVIDERSADELIANGKDESITVPPMQIIAPPTPPPAVKREPPPRVKSEFVAADTGGGLKIRVKVVSPLLQCPYCSEQFNIDDDRDASFKLVTHVTKSHPLHDVEFR